MRTSGSGGPAYIGGLGSQGSLERPSNKSPKAPNRGGSDAYLTELMSYSLDRLRKEP